MEPLSGVLSLFWNRRDKTGASDLQAEHIVVSQVNNLSLPSERTLDNHHFWKLEFPQFTKYIHVLISLTWLSR